MTCPTPNKQRHRNRSAALKARDRLETQHGIDLDLNAYRCVCGAWHLGHRHKNHIPGWARRAGLDAITRRNR